MEHSQLPCQGENLGNCSFICYSMSGAALLCLHRLTGVRGGCLSSSFVLVEGARHGLKLVNWLEGHVPEGKCSG